MCCISVFSPDSPPCFSAWFVIPWKDEISSISLFFFLLFHITLASHELFFVYRLVCYSLKRGNFVNFIFLFFLGSHITLASHELFFVYIVVSDVLDLFFVTIFLLPSESTLCAEWEVLEKLTMVSTLMRVLRESLTGHQRSLRFPSLALGVLLHHT